MPLKSGEYLKTLIAHPNQTGCNSRAQELLVGFPGGAVVENLPANAGDTGSSPGLVRSHMPWSN